jgi:GH15 family glucan-1,4-alpha-glucosidase
MLTTDRTATTHDAALILGLQHPSGAYPACPTFSQYPHSWLRDGAFIAHAMDTSGHPDSAARFHRWVVRTLTPHLGRIRALIERANPRPDPREMLPARFSLTGEWLNDDWPNFQLDGYGQWLWSLSQHLERQGRTDLGEYAEVARAVGRYLHTFYRVPCSDCWEERVNDVHTATLASIYGGLQSLSRFDSAFSGCADEVRAHILNACVKEGRFVKSDHHGGVDASLIWLATPFRVVAPDDPRMRATVAEIRRVLERDGGIIRYAEDEYYGAGAWLLLTDFLAWHSVEAGDLETARRLHAWVEARRQPNGDLPEQVAVSSTDPARLEAWQMRWGTSASPLLWSHAMHLIAARALGEVPRPLAQAR